MLSSRQFSWIIQTNSMILAAVLSTRWWLMCIIPSIIHNSQHKASMASKWQSYFYYEGRHRRPFPPFSSLSIYSSSCKVYTPFNIISWLTCQVEILNNNKKKKKNYHRYIRHSAANGGLWIVETRPHFENELKTEYVTLD